MRYNLINRWVCSNQGSNKRFAQNRYSCLGMRIFNQIEDVYRCGHITNFIPLYHQYIAQRIGQISLARIDESTHQKIRCIEPFFVHEINDQQWALNHK